MADTRLRMTQGMIQASKVVGCRVENPQNESLGKIEDLVIDLNEEHVAMAVLSLGGFLGIGEKLVAIPLAALVYDTQKGKFLLDMEKETLKNAPSFDKEQWPDLKDRSWAANVYAYYGYPPYWY